jgi:hypothetical protein
VKFDPAEMLPAMILSSPPSKRPLPPPV